jgi:hypothetical protein
MYFGLKIYTAVGLITGYMRIFVLEFLCNFKFEFFEIFKIELQ